MNERRAAQQSSIPSKRVTVPSSTASRSRHLRSPIRLLFWLGLLPLAESREESCPGPAAGVIALACVASSHPVKPVRPRLESYSPRRVLRYGTSARFRLTGLAGTMFRWYLQRCRAANRWRAFARHPRSSQVCFRFHSKLQLALQRHKSPTHDLNTSSNPKDTQQPHNLTRQQPPTVTLAPATFQVRETALALTCVTKKAARPPFPDPIHSLTHTRPFP